MLALKVTAWEMPFCFICCVHLVCSSFAPKFKAVLLLSSVGSHQRYLGTQIFSQAIPELLCGVEGMAWAGLVCANGRSKVWASLTLSRHKNHKTTLSGMVTFLRRGSCMDQEIWAGIVTFSLADISPDSLFQAESPCFCWSCFCIQGSHHHKLLLPPWAVAAGHIFLVP